MNINRTLGNGFGKDNHFNLFTQEEIYKPLINIAAFQRINEVRQWALAPVQEGPITDVVEGKELAKVLPESISKWARYHTAHQSTAWDHRKIKRSTKRSSFQRKACG